MLDRFIKANKVTRRKMPTALVASGLALISCSAFGQLQVDKGTADHPLAHSPSLSQTGFVIKGKQLSLSQAVNICLATSRLLAAAKANLYIFQGRTAEAYAALNPTLKGNLSAVKLNDSVHNKTLTVLDPHNFDNPIGANVVTSNVQQKFVGVTANLPIDISGTIRSATTLAKFQELGYRLDIDRTRNQIVADVKAAFYAVLRAKALVMVAAEDLKNSKDRLKDAQDRLAAKVVTKFDVLRAQTDMASAEQNLIVAKNVVQTNTALLNATIGVKIDDAVELSGDDAIQMPQPDSADAASSNGLGPMYDADLKEALNNRPEIQEATAFEQAAKKGIDLSRRSELPSLNLSWSYLYAPNAGGSTPLYHTWQAQALFSIPIFDAGVARARMKEAKGSLAQAQIARRQAEDQVTLETQQAYLAVQVSKQRVQVADAILDEANEAFALAKVRYKAGVSSRAGLSPLLELSDSQTALTIAETNRVNALYDYNSALAGLDRALGHFAH